MSTPPASSHGRLDPDSYYSFGPFQLDPHSRVLTNAGERVRITAKALEVLLMLVERGGETVTKTQLRGAVWGSSAVEDNNLNQCVSAIRKALGERAGEHEYILTLTGVGYRFIAPVTVITNKPAPPAKESFASASEPIVAPPVVSSNRQPLVFAAIAVVVFLVLVSAVLASAWIARRGAASRALSKLEPLPLSRNQQALDLYLEGRRIARDRRVPELNRAIRYFQGAVAKDPNFALAYAWLGETYAIEVANGAASPDMLALGEAAANKALALNPSLADAHASLGLLYYARWDWQSARRELATALRLDPNNSRALMRSAMVSFVIGNFPEAESRLHRAQALDPSNGAIAGMLGELYYYQRRYDAAIQQAEHIMQFDPENLAFAWDLKTKALMQEGHILEARSAAQKDAALSPENIGSQLGFAWLNAGGNSARFAPVFHRIIDAHATAYSSPYVLAGWYARQSDKEDAFRQLEIAYRQRVTDLVSVRWDPAFDSIRADPRYRNLLARMGLLNENESRSRLSTTN
ncbi:MAG TPA: winged helix-turn-helix domain-containing protein [Bryobacteraceae bacterium]|nr:winged helix-turn-helix domain-containing protein [Bryobacteraceae bacterium]